jgi:mRNA interferase RelE/StbE
MYDVEFSREAVRKLRDIPKTYRDRIVKRIEALAEEPRPRGCVKLKGSNSRYRIRVGVYRVLYQLFDDRLVVLIITVRHRRDAYK